MSRTSTDSSAYALDRREALALTGMLALGGAGLLGMRTAGASETTDGPEPTGTGVDGFIEAGGYTLIPYRHYASGGVGQDLYAVILFENSNATFTRYQVAYTSCTCRDAASNYRSVVYVELLNTAAQADDMGLRWVSFADNEGYDVGLWGDSNPIHGRPEYTRDYMQATLAEQLEGVTKAELDAWKTYGDPIPNVDVDAVAGATVSCSNLVALLQSLCRYHAAKHYR